MPASDLSTQLANLDASQLSTVTFLSGVDATGTVVTSGAYFIDQKIAPSTWQTSLGSGASNVTFAFDPAVSSSLFSATMQSNTAQALAIWSDIADINFVYTTDFTNADVQIVLAAKGVGTQYQATTTPPTSDPLLTQTTKGKVILNLDPGLPFGSPASYTVADGFGVSVLVHEIGHLLGLGHSGQYNQVGTTYVDFGPSQQNDSDVRLWSTMSYIDPLDGNAPNFGKYAVSGTSWLTPGETPGTGGQDIRAPYTPMGLDMIAAQRLYGAATNGELVGGQVVGFNSNVMFTDIDGTRKALSMYDFTQDVAPVVTLFDMGTNNVLDLSGFALTSIVDLNPGSWTSTSGMTNNIFIEWGTRIDGAVGGTADDTFTLNADGDRINGGGGIDTAVFAKSRSNYSFGYADKGVTLTDSKTHAVNRLTNVETALFNGSTFAVSALASSAWTGAVDSQYDTDGNWDIGLTPSDASDISIATTGTVRIDKASADFTVDSVALGAKATFDLDAGRYTITNIHQQSTIAGTFAINAVGTQVSVFLSGTMVNDGAIFLVGPDAEIVTNDHTVEIDGSGTINLTLGNIGGRTFSDATPFDTLISQNRVRGSGTIGRAGFLNSITFVNQGTVVADDVSPLTLAGSVVNKGLLSGASSLARLILNSGIDNSAGRIEAQDGGQVDMDTGTIAGGTIAAIGTGKLEVSGKTTLDGGTSPLTISGAVTVDAGARLTVHGSIVGGTIDATAGVLAFAGASLENVTLLGGAGHIQFTAPGNTIVASATLGNALTVGAGGGVTLSQNFLNGGNGFSNPQSILLQGDTATGASMGINGIVSLFSKGTVAMTGTGDVIAGVGSAVLGGELVLSDNTIVGSGLIIGTKMEIDNLAASAIIASGGTLVVDPGSKLVRSDGFLGANADGVLVFLGTVDLRDTTLFGTPGTPTFGGTGSIVLGGSDFLHSAIGVLQGGTIQSGPAFAIAGPGGRFRDGVRNQSNVTVTAGSTLTFANTVTNAGSVTLAGVFDGKTHQGATVSAFGHATLTGGGTISLHDAQDSIMSVQASDVVANLNNTIVGAGQFDGGYFNFQNFGSVIANSAGNTLVVNGGTGNMQNVGVMTATNGGTLDFEAGVTNGVDQFPDIFGLGTVAATGLGSTVILHDGTMTDGRLMTSSGGVFDVTGNYTLQSDPLATGFSVTNDANLHVLAGHTLTLLDSISNNSAIELDGTFNAAATANVGALLQFKGAFGLNGNGTVTLWNPADTLTALRAIDELDNNGNTIQGIGKLGTGDFLFVNGGTVLASNGLLTINTGNKTITNNLMLRASGGTLALASATMNSGEIDATNGTVLVQGALLGNGFVHISKGAVTLGGSVDVNQAIDFDFSTHDALLTISKITSFKGNVNGMVSGDTIDVRGVVANGVTYSAGHLNLLSNGTIVAALNMPVTPQGALSVASDKAGGTNVFIAVACFREGTSIRTPDGDRRVEALAVGDAVTTGFGATRHIRWIGRRTIDCIRHPRPAAVSPVRIAPHAFGPSAPDRALFLSPDHAVFVEHVLIPVKHLINDTTVAQVAVDTVSYFHIELDQHDVVLANGLATESYLDTGDRGSFANGDRGTRLFPDFSGDALVLHRWEASGCAPLMAVGPEVLAARSRLAERAAAIHPEPARRAA